MFKLNRILDMEILNESFLRRIFPEPMDAPAGEYREIVLCFSEKMAYRVYDEFDRTQVQEQADGSLIVCAQLPEDEWLTGFLLSFGTHVEILSPGDLRERVAAQAKLIYEKYKT